MVKGCAHAFRLFTLISDLNLIIKITMKLIENSKQQIDCPMIISLPYCPSLPLLHHPLLTILQYTYTYTHEYIFIFVIKIQLVCKVYKEYLNVRK